MNFKEPDDSLLYTIYLKNGRSLSVNITDENRDFLRIQNSKGYSSILSKELINEVQSFRPKNKGVDKIDE